MVTQEKILFVDDEPAVLQGYQRMLHDSFRVDTAVGAKGALITMTTKGPYAVVVSDMRMPEMDGLEFLSRVEAGHRVGRKYKNIDQNLLLALIQDGTRSQ